LRFNDNLNLQMGTDNDISFFYNGSDFYMDFQTAGDSWYIRDSGDNAVFGFTESTGNLSLYKGSVLVGDGGDQSTVQIKKADNDTSDHIQFYNGTTRMGEIGCQDTTWLRINQETNKNIYTPRYIRADAGFFVDGTSKGINGSGNFIGGTIAGASDYGTLLRSDANDTFTGNLANNGNNYITFGPNSSWSRYLRVGGNGYQGSSTVANIATTNGNLHLDAASGGFATYLNYYAGTVGVGFGNGSSAAVAWMGPDGDLWKGSSDNNGSKYWHAGNDGSGSGLDADTLDGVNSGSFLRSDSNDIYTGTLTGAGNISFTGGVIEIGEGSGSVAMTINDGYGNANLAFNHASGVPDVNGNSLRIETNVDSTTTAQFVFEGKSNVTANSAVALTELFKMTETEATCLGNTVWHAGNDGSGSGLDADTVDGIQGSALAPIASPTFTGDLTIPGAIKHTGDTNTYIQFHGNDLFRVVINGAEVQEWGNNYTLLSDNDQLRLGTSSDFRMVFNGADTVFRNYAHTDGDIIFQGENSSGSNQNILIMKTDTTRTYNILYENNAERLRTVSTGVNITGALVATGDVTAFSDITLKEDVEVIPNALDKVSQIRGVTFTRKDFEDKSRKSGVIAQEVEKVLPEVVTTTEDGTKTVAYGNLVGLLIESIKELKAEVAELKEKCK